MKTLITLSIIAILFGCSKKTIPSINHEELPENSSSRDMRQDGLKESQVLKDLKKDLKNKSSTTLANALKSLENEILNYKYIKDQSNTLTETFDIYTHTLLQLMIKDYKASIPHWKKFQRFAMDDCDGGIKICNNLTFFNKSPWVKYIFFTYVTQFESELSKSITKENSVEKTDQIIHLYQYIIITRSISASSVFPELYGYMLKYASYYQNVLESTKTQELPIKSKPELANLLDMALDVVGNFMHLDTVKSSISSFIEKSEAFNVLEKNDSIPSTLNRPIFLMALKNHFRDEQGEYTPLFKHAVEYAYNKDMGASKSFHSMLSKLKSVIGKKALMQFELPVEKMESPLYKDEYFFITDLIFRENIDTDMLSDIWNFSKKDTIEIHNKVLDRVRLELLYLAQYTNEELQRIYLCSNREASDIQVDPQSPSLCLRLPAPQWEKYVGLKPPSTLTKGDLFQVVIRRSEEIKPLWNRYLEKVNKLTKFTMANLNEESGQMALTIGHIRKYVDYLVSFPNQLMFHSLYAVNRASDITNAQKLTMDFKSRGRLDANLNEDQLAITFARVQSDMGMWFSFSGDSNRVFIDSESLLISFAMSSKLNLIPIASDETELQKYMYKTDAIALTKRIFELKQKNIQKTFEKPRKFINERFSLYNQATYLCEKLKGIENTNHYGKMIDYIKNAKPSPTFAKLDKEIIFGDSQSSGNPYEELVKTVFSADSNIYNFVPELSRSIKQTYNYLDAWTEVLKTSIITRMADGNEERMNERFKSQVLPYLESMKMEQAFFLSPFYDLYKSIKTCGIRFQKLSEFQFHYIIKRESEFLSQAYHSLADGISFDPEWMEYFKGTQMNESMAKEHMTGKFDSSVAQINRFRMSKTGILLRIRKYLSELSGEMISISGDLNDVSGEKEIIVSLRTSTINPQHSDDDTTSVNGQEDSRLVNEVDFIIDGLKKIFSKNSGIISFELGKYQYALQPYSIEILSNIYPLREITYISNSNHNCSYTQPNRMLECKKESLSKIPLDLSDFIKITLDAVSSIQINNIASFEEFQIKTKEQAESNQNGIEITDKLILNITGILQKEKTDLFINNYTFYNEQNKIIPIMDKVFSKLVENDRSNKGLGEENIGNFLRDNSNHVHMAARFQSKFRDIYINSLFKEFKTATDVLKKKHEEEILGYLNYFYDFYNTIVSAEKDRSMWIESFHYACTDTSCNRYFSAYSTLRNNDQIEFLSNETIESEEALAKSLVTTKFLGDFFGQYEEGQSYKMIEKLKWPEFLEL